jgi:putative transposase
MQEKSNIVRLRQQGEIIDPRTNILQSGARQLRAKAAEMEAEAVLAAMKDMKLPAGRDRLVRDWAPPGAQDSDRDRSRRGQPGEDPG